MGAGSRNTGVIRGQFKEDVLKDGQGEFNCFHGVSFSEIVLKVCSFSSCLCAASPPPWSLRALLLVSITSVLKLRSRFPLSGGVASLVGLNTCEKEGEGVGRSMGEPGKRRIEVGEPRCGFNGSAGVGVGPTAPPPCSVLIRRSWRARQNRCTYNYFDF